MGNSSTKHILIADDEPLFLRTTAALLRKEGFDCTCADNGIDALKVLAKEQVDLVLSDLNMPGNIKLELLKEGRSHWPDIPLIVITGAPSLPSAIESVRLGITDYLLKPVKLEDLLSSIRRALAHRDRQKVRSIPEAQPDHQRFPEIIGESPPMQELFEIIARVADTDTNVLITGESGTGKEAVARAIHRLSRRAKEPFQIVDCTAVPETLFESILFGHTRGAFTGAVKDQEGLLGQADRGTAFFDEIGELPVTLQSKLLRVIQEQTFIPVGKTTAVTVDTRFVCATNRDLELEVNAGRFRRDLFYRLAVIPIELPRLSERGDDVVLLAEHFLRLLQDRNPRVCGISEEALQLLRQHKWPGNIRELRNAIERAIALARGDTIEAYDLPSPIQRASERLAVAPVRDGPTHADVLGGAEREYIASLLKKNAGNVAQSAREAGLSRQGLHKLLKRHNLDANQFRE
jgi:DNA-binding NtrC family response regulator